METEEYTNLDEQEARHWYYVGKRDAVRYWIERYGALSREKVLLDCGAGTGLFAKSLGASCQVRVLDSHPESLKILKRRFNSEQILEGSCQSIPLPDRSVDVLTALDVLEHLEDDAAAVAEFQRVLNPGGVIVATVPAMMCLWSDWDEALHHFRRYRRHSFLQLFSPLYWDDIHTNYTNVLAFPLVWALRRLRRGGGGASRRAEDVVPPAWINAILREMFVRTATMRHVRFPFGVSLILAARRGHSTIGTLRSTVPSERTTPDPSARSPCSLSK